MSQPFWRVTEDLQLERCWAIEVTFVFTRVSFLPLHTLLCKFLFLRCFSPSYFTFISCAASLEKEILPFSRKWAFLPPIIALKAVVSEEGSHCEAWGVGSGSLPRMKFVSWSLKNKVHGLKELGSKRVKICWKQYRLPHRQGVPRGNPLIPFFSKA